MFLVNRPILHYDKSRREPIDLLFSHFSSSFFNVRYASEKGVWSHRAFDGRLIAGICYY